MKKPVNPINVLGKKWLITDYLLQMQNLLLLFLQTNGRYLTIQKLWLDLHHLAHATQLYEQKHRSDMQCECVSRKNMHKSGYFLIAIGLISCVEINQIWFGCQVGYSVALARHLSLKMEVAAEYTKALIRVRYFLLHLKKASCFSSPTGFKMNLQMLFNTTWHNFFSQHYNQPALSGSRFTRLVFHSNLSLWICMWIVSIVSKWKRQQIRIGHQNLGFKSSLNYADCLPQAHAWRQHLRHQTGRRQRCPAPLSPQRLETGSSFSGLEPTFRALRARREPYTSYTGGSHRTGGGGTCKQEKNYWTCQQSGTFSTDGELHIERTAGLLATHTGPTHTNTTSVLSFQANLSLEIIMAVKRAADWVNESLPLRWKSQWFMSWSDRTQCKIRIDFQTQVRSGKTDWENTACINDSNPYKWCGEQISSAAWGDDMGTLVQEWMFPGGAWERDTGSAWNWLMGRVVVGAIKTSSDGALDVQTVKKGFFLSLKAHACFFKRFLSHMQS